MDDRSAAAGRAGRDSPDGHGRRGREVLKLCLMAGLTFFGAGSLQTFLTPYLGKAGHPESTCGLLLTILYFSQAAGRFVSGVLVPRLGLKAAVVGGLGAYVLFPLAAVVCVTLSPSLESPALAALMLAAAFWGFASATFWTSTQSQLLNDSTPETRGRNNGLLHLSLQSGLLAGLLCLSLVARGSGDGPSAIFARQMAIAALACAAGLAVSFGLHPRGSADRPRGFGLALRATFRRDSLALGAILLACGTSYGMVLNGINRIVSARYGEGAFFQALCGYYLATGITSYFGGRLSDRIGRAAALGGALLLGACGAACVVLSRSAEGVSVMALLAAAGFLLGALFGLGPGVINAWIGDLTEPQDRPSAIAGAFFWRDLGIGLGVQARTFASASADPAGSSFLALAILYAMLAAAMPLIKKRVTEAKGVGRS